ncbi:hypothetical protein MJI37_33795, partial [Salmonella enterica subsp. enterica serovar Cerro]|nr:hypothetical protein [Salmonella enterica subsp. enterica serovar Cerro]
LKTQPFSEDSHISWFIELISMRGSCYPSIHRKMFMTNMTQASVVVLNEKRTVILRSHWGCIWINNEELHDESTGNHN